MTQVSANATTRNRARSTPCPAAIRTLLALPRGLRGELASGMIELSVAMAVLTVAIVGVAGAMSLATVTAGHARQRSVASALSSERIERLRNLPYDQVALDDAPTHVSDPANPDWYVTQEVPPRYDVRQDGTLYEPLVVGGNVRHVEDPVVRAQTQLFVYQYVTWVDDANIAGAQDYKRVTVVVTWRNELHKGSSPRIAASTFVAAGPIHLPQSAPTQASPDPVPSPAPAPSSAPSCDGDTSAPVGSLEIISGAGAGSGYSSSANVQARLQTTDACPDLRAELSNDGEEFISVGDLASGIPSTVTWTVPSGDGGKTVYARYGDGAGNVSAVSQASIVLDLTPPTVPGGLRQVSCTMTGASRQVLLTWDASSDANLAGYRLSRSENSSAWQVVATTSTLQAEDTTRKSLDIVRYLVRAYDRAGNESGDSNVVTYSRNRC